MWISRVRVNGGFLAGLDIALAPGLNVIVGARGTGKTTLLELIRHALGIEHADPVQAKKQLQTVAQLLDSGEVIIDLADGTATKHIVVDSRGGGRSLETQAAALVLGQNELESIASDPSGRLRLIDLRATVVSNAPSLEVAGQRTAQVADVRGRIENLMDALNRRAVLMSDRAELVLREAEHMSRLGHDGAQQRELLRSIEGQMLQLTDHAGVSMRAQEVSANVTFHQEQVAQGLAELSRLKLDFLIPPGANAILREAITSADLALSQLNLLRNAFAQARDSLQSRENQLRLEAEPLRAELEAVEVGLGQVTAQIRNIDVELAELDRADTQLEELRSLLQALESSRNVVLDEYEAWQESLYEARLEIADKVSSDLDNRVIVEVHHLADSSAFRDVLESHMQGSGLQYRAVAETLGRTVLPRQLLSILEHNDVEALTHASGLAADRAARAIGALSSPAALTAISTVVLDDRIDFKLLVGTQTKPVQDLSTGQKCAVTLPIVLTERSRILVLDQPEDHLDNAYLVKNVIKALSRRSDAGAQTIVATHNANIPVLGSAPAVLELESDGLRGFVQHRGSFDSPEIVKTITDLMEGGKDAFRLRAEFYDEFGEPA